MESRDTTQTRQDAAGPAEAQLASQWCVAAFPEAESTLWSPGLEGSKTKSWHTFECTNLSLPVYLEDPPSNRLKWKAQPNKLTADFQIFSSLTLPNLMQVMLILHYKINGNHIWLMSSDLRY